MCDIPSWRNNDLFADDLNSKIPPRDAQSASLFLSFYPSEWIQSIETSIFYAFLLERTDLPVEAE